MGITRKLKHVYDRVDYSAGKKLFGNTVGIKNNLSGSLKSKQGGKALGNVNDPRINDLRTKQHLKLENFYDVSLIEKISERYNELINDEKYSHVSGEYEGKIYSKHISDPEKHIPDLDKLITREIKEIANGYYQGNFRISNIAAWRNYHVPKEIESQKELFSNYWHCDNRSTEYLKLFVPIHDITEKHGPFHTMSQKRTKELMKKGFGTREEYNISETEINDPNHVVKLICTKGSAYFANPQLCLHKAGTPSKDNLRDIIVFVFAPSDKPLPDNWFENFEQDQNYHKSKEK